MASAVACKAAELPSGLKKLLAEPSASAVACKATELPICLQRLFTLPFAKGTPMSFYAPRPAAVAASRRPCTTQGKEVQRYDDDDDDSSSESDREHEDADSVDRRRARDFVVPSSFSQSDDVLRAPTSLGRMLSRMEDIAPQTGLSSTAGASRLGWWVAKEDDDAVYLKVPMPGLGKEHVKVRADKNILVIKGEGEKGDDDYAVPRYNGRIEIPADACKMDKTKGEMKNGVLSLTVLKVKEEERKDVFQVKIE